MDPQATVHELLDAMARNDRVAVDEHLSNLKEWNMQGGFLPSFEKGMNAFVVHRDTLKPKKLNEIPEIKKLEESLAVHFANESEHEPKNLGQEMRDQLVTQLKVAIAHFTRIGLGTHPEVLEMKDVLKKATFYNTHLGVPYSVDYTIHKEGKLVKGYKTLEEALCVLPPRGEGKSTISKGHEVVAVWCDDGWAVGRLAPTVKVTKATADTMSEEPGDGRLHSIADVIAEFKRKQQERYPKEFEAQAIGEPGIPGESGKCVMDHADVSNFQKQEAEAARNVLKNAGIVFVSTPHDWTGELDYSAVEIEAAKFVANRRRSMEAVSRGRPTSAELDEVTIAYNEHLDDAAKKFSLTKDEAEKVLEDFVEKYPGVAVAKAAQAGMTRSHAAEVKRIADPELSEFTAEVFGRLPDLEDERDYDSVATTITQRYEEGWSLNDTVEFLFLTEEVAGDSMEEDEALAKMAVIIERNKKDE